MDGAPLEVVDFDACMLGKALPDGIQFATECTAGGPECIVKAQAAAARWRE
jgi:hypothetical protein